MEPSLEETDNVHSPTVSAQDVLRRMSLNSPPSRSDNPRQVKRAKVRAGAIGGGSKTPSRGHSALPSKTPSRRMPTSRVRLAAPSPMSSWGLKGVNLRDASAGEALEASEPVCEVSSFGLDCLREPSTDDCDTSLPLDGSPASTTMDDTEEEESSDDAFVPQPPMARPHASAAEGGGGGGSSISAALEEAGREGPVPETPMRRPGSGARARLERRAREGAKDRSCSPVAFEDSIGALEQGSPIKKRSSIGRLHLSGDCIGARGNPDGDYFPGSPLRSNRNPFSPGATGERAGRREPRDHGNFNCQGQSSSGDGHKEYNKSMPAPAPRSRLASGGSREPSAGDDSPMDTGDSVDFSAVSGLNAFGGGDEGSFLRRISVGSCVSVSDTGGGLGKALDDVSKPSPCDVTAFVPVTPCRRGVSSMEAESGERGGGSMSPDSDYGRRPYFGVEKGASQREDSVGGGEMRGRFTTDFEELEVIGSGSFGTVYKVRSRVDGCLYAVKCTRRRFRGEADRQNMLREVYALAAVCDAQDTTNIVRYHQAWIEDERLYIQTELCETSLEKQLEKGMNMEISSVYAFLRQTLLGLSILHQHDMVHLDIKPGNIFVKNGQYKLGDFGLVSPVHVKSGADVVEGDSRYMSKELLNDDHSNLTKCDVFSLGITLFEIISGRPLPPNGEEWQRLRSGSVRMPMGMPVELSQTLNRMMDPEPTRRPSAGELLRYPCLQSEMEKQLNDQKSKLNKERTQNEALKLEVSALIQKQSQRSGRLSRTITWDNSYFSTSNPARLMRQFDSSTTATAKDSGKTTATSADPAPSSRTLCSTCGTPPLGASLNDGGRFKRSLLSPVFGSGVSAPRFGEEKVEGSVSFNGRGSGLLRSAATAGQGLTSLPEKEEASFER